tara:strand:- start:314890 stop:315033 length:144 start_codon:yes stop_codon:yes gene_type:complete
MKDLTKKYEAAKAQSKEFMRNGNISAYFDKLIEMNRYKSLIVSMVAN